MARRFIGFLFRVSDFFGWLFLFIFAAVAFLYPFIAPISAKMFNEKNILFQNLITSGIFILLACIFWLSLKRSVIANFILFCFFIFLAFIGKSIVFVLFGLIFILPNILAYIESRVI